MWGGGSVDEMEGVCVCVGGGEYGRYSIQMIRKEKYKKPILPLVPN